MDRGEHAAVRDLGTSIRSLSAAETIASITPFLDRYDIKGFVDHSPDGGSVLKSIEVIRGNPRSGYLNLGKGFGLQAALASGYMEAIEMCTIETAPQIETVIRAQDGCGLIMGVDLLTGQPVQAPVDDHFLPAGAPCEIRSCKISTNGLASGNTVTEARLHAIYELIERHLTGLSLRDPSAVRRLMLRDHPPLLVDALREVEALGLRADFFLLGRALGVTAVTCVLSPVDGQTADIFYGWGAQHSDAIAIGRALAEAMQALATRRACQADALPLARMPGGALISADRLRLLRGPVTQGEHDIAKRYAGCPDADMSLSGVGSETGPDAVDAPRVPAAALSAVLDAARADGVASVCAWTLSPPDRPFAVVKCVIPDFADPFAAA